MIVAIKNKEDKEKVIEILREREEQINEST